MSMGRTLNIPDPQVLIHHPGDANGYFHHHRLLLHKIGGGQWVALTPDLDLEVQDLSSTRHRVLARHAPLPADIAAECYIFDELFRAELETQKRLARTMGAILNVDEQQRYVADPSSSGFGQAIIPAKFVGDIVALGQHGVVSWEDEIEFVKEMTTSDIEQFKESKKDTLGDARLGEQRPTRQAPRDPTGG